MSEKLISERGWREILGALRADGKGELADIIADAHHLTRCGDPCCNDEDDEHDDERQGATPPTESRFSIVAFTDASYMLRASAQADPKGGPGRWDAWLPAGAVVTSVVSLPVHECVGPQGFKLLIAWHLPGS
jgi:hypothetical protein